MCDEYNDYFFLNKILKRGYKIFFFVICEYVMWVLLLLWQRNLVIFSCVLKELYVLEKIYEVGIVLENQDGC